MINTHGEELSSDPQAEEEQNAWEGSNSYRDQADRDTVGEASTGIRTPEDSKDDARIQMIKRAQSRTKLTEDSTEGAAGPFDTTKDWDSGTTTEGDTREYGDREDTNGGGANPWENYPISPGD